MFAYIYVHIFVCVYIVYANRFAVQPAVRVRSPSVRVCCPLGALVWWYYANSSNISKFYVLDYVNQCAMKWKPALPPQKKNTKTANMCVQRRQTSGAVTNLGLVRASESNKLSTAVLIAIVAACTLPIVVDQASDTITEIAHSYICMCIHKSKYVLICNYVGVCLLVLVNVSMGRLQQRCRCSVECHISA